MLSILFAGIVTSSDIYTATVITRQLFIVCIYFSLNKWLLYFTRAYTIVLLESNCY